MSRSVKSLQPCHPTLAMTGRLFWLMAIVLLITQLVNSSSHGFDYLDSGPDDLPFQQDRSRDRPDDDRLPDDDKTSSILKFKTADFEISFDISNGKDQKEERNIPLVPESGETDLNETIRKIFGSHDKAASRSHRRSLDRFGLRKRSEGLGTPSVPAACNGEYTCGEALSYPADEINDVMRKQTIFQNMSHIDEMPADGGGPDVIEDTLCQSTKQTLFMPKAVRKSLGDPWIHVANTENFVQGFLVSTCTSENAPCEQHFENIFEGHTAVCKQHHSYRAMVVINATITLPYVSSFLLPSGCCCYKKSHERSYRMGTNSVDEP